MIITMIHFFGHNTLAFDPDSEFLKLYNCKHLETLDIEYNNGFAPYTLQWIDCGRNISPSMYSNTTCSTRCQDPSTNQFLSEIYQQRPILVCETFQIRRRGQISKIRIKLAKGCKCVRYSDEYRDNIEIDC
uniref:uncharacterized protein LOC120337102 n=1 Tax=Styela clava TaxID=7725 RepID=UPI00193971EF|nr:uncharacterized protein LOC120337102 [Styela clava]